ncbi:Csu type fimbrial protein [Idiomarina fontislapidosi]|uniref:Spore coat protein U/FanG domain-containing protein n=1 Tax=Idiomarina fontislapidosi TaxID=263723 RepID=A0A432XV88_9GAMM|nr:spore coat U domain-containing protein [Idiomarina fontislapidosi]RUO52511.1 hypothetical protein CWE25_09285 [Idiomarina fontislapidosi]
MKSISYLLLMTAWAWSSLSWAQVTQTQSDSVIIKLEMVPFCQLHTENVALDFGTVDQFSPSQSLMTQTRVSLTCARGSDYQVSLDGGLNGQDGQRFVESSAGDTLPYQLYDDNQLSNPWLNNEVRSFTGTGVEQEIVIYSELVSDSLAGVGQYSDTVTFYVNY